MGCKQSLFTSKTVCYGKVQKQHRHPGLSGRIDELVFRQRFGQTVVTRNPRVSREPSDAQLSLRSRFRQAAAYAKAAVSDAATKLFYGSKAKEGQSAYNVALADFFNTPEIGEIDTSAYNGSIGSRITVSVSCGQARTLLLNLKGVNIQARLA